MDIDGEVCRQAQVSDGDVLDRFPIFIFVLQNVAPEGCVHVGYTCRL